MIDEIGSVLCFGTIFLAVVTVVGHGIWLLIAAFVRWLSGAGKADNRYSRPCPACGGVIEGGINRCPHCGHERVISERAQAENDAAATIRQLNRLRGRGLIDASEYQRLMSLLLADTRPSVPAPAAESTREPQPSSTASSSPFAPTEVDEADEIVDAIVFEDVQAEPVAQPSAPPVPAAPPSATPPVRPQAASHALDREYTAAVPQVSVPRQKLADLLQAFMAEKSIRWGELVAGLLIVGSGVGLVISLRDTLSEAIPYFVPLLFMLITLAIYGAGMYTLRRWNLRSTSRGVLTIALLLTPLNFLAAIIMSGPHDRAVTDPEYILAVAIGTAVAGWITFSAGRALVPTGWWRLTAVILATCLGQLVIDRQAFPGATLGWISALAALPMSGFLVATVTQLQRAIHWRNISTWRANQMFLVLGVSVFALLVPMGLLVSQSGALRQAMAQISPSFSLASAVVLATGLLLHRRIRSEALAAIRTVGTALAITGAMMMGAAVVLAWPRPDLLIAVGVTNCVILVVVAVVGRLPILHVAAVGCLALAALVGFHSVQGGIAGESPDPGWELARLLVMGRSAVVLAVLSVLAGGVAVALRQSKRRLDSLSYLWGAAGLATASVVVAAWSGFGPGGDADWATLVFGFYAVASIAAARVMSVRTKEQVQLAGQVAAWAGSGLLLAALVHGLWLNEPIGQWLAASGVVLHRPIVTAILVHANCCAVVAAVFVWKGLFAPSVDRDGPLWTALANPLTISAVVAATIVVPSSLWVKEQALAHHAGYLFAAAFVWMVTAILYRRHEAIAVFQGLTSIAILFLTASFCRDADWSSQWWLDPRHFQAQLIVLAAWCLLWGIVRRLSARQATLRELIQPPWPAVDELLLIGSLLGLCRLAISACWPGLLHELGATNILAVDAVHSFSYAAGSWVALAVIVAAMIVPLGKRWPGARLVGLLVAAAVIPLLLSARWEETGAVASALRWTFAGYALVTAAVIWVRSPLADRIRRVEWLGWSDGASPSLVRDMALVLGGVPVVLITTAVVWRSVAGWPTGAPVADSLFDQMGLTVSYAIPLLTLVAVLVGHALREKQAHYMLAGSMLLQYVVCLAYMLRVPNSQASFGANLLQWNLIALGGYSLLWLFLKTWMRRSASPGPQSGTGRAVGADVTSRTSLYVRGSDLPLVIQLSAMLLLLAVLCTWAALSVFVSPGRITEYASPLGEAPSYVAWGLALAAVLWCAVRYPSTLPRTEESHEASSQLGAKTLDNLVRLLSYFLLGGVAIASVGAEQFDPQRHWLAYHVLTFGWLAIAAGLTAATFAWRALWREAIFVCVLVMVLATRGSVVDASPLAPWWSVAAAATVAVLVAILSLRYRNQWFAYASLVPVGLATSFYWIGGLTGRWPVDGAQAVADLLQANLIALAFSGLFWIVVDLWYQRTDRSEGFDVGFRLAPVHVVAALVGVVLSVVYFVGIFGINCLGREFSSSGVFDSTGLGPVAALAGLGLLLLVALWEHRRGYAIPCLYVWGIAVVALGLDRLDLPIQQAFLAVTMAGAGYVMLTGLAWRQGAWLASIASNLGVRDPIQGLKQTAIWLPVVNLLIAAASMLAALLIVSIFPERWMRITSGMAPAMLALGLAALAQKERRTLLEFASLLMTGVAAVCLSWADLEPEWGDRGILLRLIRLLIVLSGLTFLYGVIVARFVSQASSWMAPVRRIAVTFGGSALIALVAVLVAEAAIFQPGVDAPIETSLMLVVVVVLVALTGGFISLALLPGRDPFTLSERGRMGYVYAAEVVASLIFAHVYLCRPSYFSGRISAYWPYIVMAIAFAGVSVGELFRRRGLVVLALPFQRTGAFLPLLPALGFWIIAAEKTDYATLLFIVGLMYLLLSGMRKSIASGMAAALAANAALWTLLMDSGVSIWEHPQFWLIPPAASALIAGQLNRRRLSSNQLAALRYASIAVIYLSSTSEIFIRGIGDSLWPPIILASLAVAGVFLGIILQVRAFLYLGTSFVLLSVISMVWHAQRAIQHSWPWWAFLIGLGLCILVFFAVFEKQRPQITRWIDRLRQWEK